jgi:hypothetical protein
MGQSEREQYARICSAEAPHFPCWHSEDPSGREGTMGESQGREKEVMAITYLVK